MAITGDFNHLMNVKMNYLSWKYLNCLHYLWITCYWYQNDYIYVNNVILFCMHSAVTPKNAEIQRIFWFYACNWLVNIMEGLDTDYHQKKCL